MLMARLPPYFNESVFAYCYIVSRKSDTPTTTPPLLKKYRNTPPICIAVRLQFVLPCFWCPYALRKGKYGQNSSICVAVRLPFVLQYAFHLYRGTFRIILVVVVSGMFPIHCPKLIGNVLILKGEGSQMRTKRNCYRPPSCHFA